MTAARRIAPILEDLECNMSLLTTTGHYLTDQMHYCFHTKMLMKYYDISRKLYISLNTTDENNSQNLIRMTAIELTHCWLTVTKISFSFLLTFPSVALLRSQTCMFC